MEKNNPDKILAPFLRQLADDIDSEKLSANQRQKLGEFYISWLLNSELENSDGNLDEDIEEDYDLFKFLTMGWYVYTQILEGHTI